MDFRFEYMNFGKIVVLKIKEYIFDFRLLWLIMAQIGSEVTDRPEISKPADLQAENATEELEAVMIFFPSL